jgi:MFS family permease
MSENVRRDERRRFSATETHPALPTLGGVQLPPEGRSIEVLRSRPFLVFLASTVATTAGLWLFETTLYWTALSSTGSADATGLILTALIVPVLLFILPMGVVTDRWGDRRLLLLSQVAWLATMVAAVLIAHLGRLTFSVAILLALADGLIDAVWVVPAQVLLARLVDRPLMAKAIAFGTLQVAFGRIIGGYGAGRVLASAGPTATFTLGATCLLIGVVLMAFLRPKHSFADRRAHSGLLDGARFAASHRPVLALYTMGASVALFLYGYLSILPVVSRSLLHAGPDGLGLMTGAGGIGTLVAVWLIDPLGRRLGRGTSLLGAAAVASVAMVVLGASRSQVLSAVAAGTITGSLMFYSATNTTLLQSLAPPDLRGRVLSFFGLAFWAMMPVSGLGAGYIADRFGVSPALVAMGLAAGIGLVAIKVFYRPLSNLDVSDDGTFVMRGPASLVAERPAH